MANEAAYKLIDADLEGETKPSGPTWSPGAAFALGLIPMSYPAAVVVGFATYGYQDFSAKELDAGPKGSLTQSGMKLTYGALTVQKETSFHVKINAGSVEGPADVKAVWGVRMYGSARPADGVTQSYDWEYETNPITSVMYLG